MMAAPKVSIVMPMYNAEKYVEKTVRSMLAQTYEDFEFIIVDDGSRDGCAAITERLAKEDSRIRLMPLAKNGGYSVATNHGMQAARGEYIVTMDSDDISLPERLAKQVAYLDSHPDAGLVATLYWRMDPEDRLMRKTYNAFSDAVLKFHLLFGVPVCNPTTAIRKAVIAPFNGIVFNPELTGGPEYDFMVRIADNWRFHVIPEYLFKYRIHAGGMGTQRKDTVMREILSRALPYILRKMPSLKGREAEVEAFIRLQRDNSQPMTGERLKDYMTGLELLRSHYVRHVPAAERREINAFCFELEAKTLLGRYRLYKKPALVLRWLLSPRNHLRFAPVWFLHKLVKGA